MYNYDCQRNNKIGLLTGGHWCKDFWLNIPKLLTLREEEIDLLHPVVIAEHLEHMNQEAHKNFLCIQSIPSKVDK